MKMYRCEECGNLFEEGEQAEWTEMHGFSYGNGEEWQGCPICKGDYEEINPCKICGGYDNETNDGFCEKCQKDIMKRFNQLIQNNFSEEEIEFLKEEQEYGLL